MRLRIRSIYSITKKPQFLFGQPAYIYQVSADASDRRCLVWYLIVNVMSSGRGNKLVNDRLCFFLGTTELARQMVSWIIEIGGKTLIVNMWCRQSIVDEVFQVE